MHISTKICVKFGSIWSTTKKVMVKNIFLRSRKKGVCLKNRNFLVYRWIHSRFSQICRAHSGVQNLVFRFQLSSLVRSQIRFSRKVEEIFVSKSEVFRFSWFGDPLGDMFSQRFWIPRHFLHQIRYERGKSKGIYVSINGLLCEKMWLFDQAKKRKFLREKTTC